MKKRNTKSAVTGTLTKEALEKLRQASKHGRLTIGLDLGDRYSDLCILGEGDEVLVQERVPTTAVGLQCALGKMPASVVAMEVGTHSPWVSRAVAAMGHEVVVANPRNVAWITKSRKKNDRLDAEKLARLARADVKLLSPIRHRGEQTQRDLLTLRARFAVVRARTKLINAARGLVKSTGERLAGCDADAVKAEMADKLSPELAATVKPMLEAVEELNKTIHGYETEMEAMKKRYPEVELLTAVYGVGTIVALAFVLTIEDPARFGKSRDVGAYLGLAPGLRESGQQEPAMRITKEGDRDMRRLLVQSAQRILRKAAPDSDSRRWGLEKLGEGAGSGKESGKKKNSQKKRVIVAVARRLAVLLHHLWVNGEVYDPLYGAKEKQRAEARAQAKVQRRTKAA